MDNLVKIYNNTLNPDLWNSDNTLKPEVRDSLLKIAEDFYAETELEAPIQEIMMLGSSANYNWSKYSDVDIHILVDFNQFSEVEKPLYEELFYLKKSWRSLKNQG